MAKHPQNKPPVQKKTAAAVNSAIGIQSGVVPIQQQTTQLYQGPVPHPEILERFDNLVPGTAARMFQLAEDESKHRRELETRTNDANIAAQQKQLSIAEYQSRSVFRSDTIGQVAGVFVSLSCIVGAVYLALDGREFAAAALAAIPTAAVIQAFFAKKSQSSTDKK